MPALANNTLYLYDTQIDLVLTGNQYELDNRPMNTRHLKAHRGITNTIHFRVTDRDRVGQNMNTRITQAVITDPTTRSQVLTKATQTTLNSDVITLQLTPQDIQDLEAGLYEMYLVTEYQPGGHTGPLYSPQNNDLSFQLEVTDQGRVDPQETQTTESMFIGVGNIVTSGALRGNQQDNSDPQHTMAITTQAFTGTITVQSSQLNNVPSEDANSSHWSNLFSVEANNSTSVHSFTFLANTNWLRVRYEPADANSLLAVTQVQLRN